MGEGACWQDTLFSPAVVARRRGMPSWPAVGLSDRNST
jgi:hypothetical protein